MERSPTTRFTNAVTGSNDTTAALTAEGAAILAGQHHSLVLAGEDTVLCVDDTPKTTTTSRLRD